MYGRRLVDIFFPHFSCVSSGCWELVSRLRSTRVKNVSRSMKDQFMSYTVRNSRMPHITLGPENGNLPNAELRDSETEDVTPLEFPISAASPQPPALLMNNLPRRS